MQTFIINHLSAVVFTIHSTPPRGEPAVAPGWEGKNPTG